MRFEPERLRFEIEALDGAARAGVIHTAHGPIETPAFIPLATKGTVRGLESREVAELGYELILGNTYHLFVSPGPERIAAAGGLHGFMGWERAIITDSGGFQVFSLAHGGVANEVKGSGRSGGGHGSRVEITEEGARFRSPRDGAELFISPEVSMSVQAALGSDIALVFDECTPVPRRARLHRALDRAHPPLARSLPRLARPRGAGAAGGLRDRPGRRLRGPAARVGAGGERGGGRRAGDRRHPRPRQGGDGGGAGDDRAALAGRGAEAPAGDRRGRRFARRDRAWASTSSTVRCRPGWRATASRSPRAPRPAGASIFARDAGLATASRSSPAARAPPASATTATTSAT